LLAGAQSRGGTIDLLSGRFWLANSRAGSVMLANGSSAKVELRITIKGAKGDTLEVIRVGDQSLLLDRKSGDVSRLDVADLKVANSQNLPNAENVSLLAVGDKLVVVDPHGTVSVEDPTTLRTLSTVRVGQPLTRGVVTADGTVWVGEPTAGVIVPLTLSTDGHLRSGKSVTVGADAKMELALVNNKPTVVAVARRAIVTIEGSTASSAVPFPMIPGDSVAVPPTVIGSLFPISINMAGQLVLVDGNAARSVDLGLQRKELGGPVPFDGSVYVADYTDGRVVVVDPSGNHANAPGINIPANVRFSLTVDGGRLWLDDPNGTEAFVLNQGNRAFRSIDKSAPSSAPIVQPRPPVTTPRTLPNPSVSGPSVNNQASTTLPPSPVTTILPSPPPLPPSPVITIPPSAPGAPTNVRAVAGNATATVSWGPATADGAAVQRYDVSWTVSGTGGTPGKTIIPASSLQTVLSSLTNGATYTFTVVAKNSVGVGPGSVSPSVTPSSTVPSPPGAATATPNADGSIDLVWPAADGQGHLIQGYDITAASTGSGGAPATLIVASKITGTTAHVTTATGLVLGTSYTFTLIATNDLSTASTPSQPSNAVTPYLPALPPGSPTAKVSGTGINVNWQQPVLNGGTLVSYAVSGDNGLIPQTISVGTSATFDGLTPGTSYTFTIATTTSANGETVTGLSSTTPATAFGIVPSVSNLSASLSADRTISVSLSVDGHNSGPVTCDIYFNGGVAWQGGCGTSVSTTVAGLAYSTTYDIYATADDMFGNSGPSNHFAVRTNDPPPPPPSVTVSRGARGVSPNGTCKKLSDNCNWVHVAIRNFAPSTSVRIGCSSSGPEFYHYSVTTGSGGSSDSEFGGCIFGPRGATVTVTANGVSGSVVW
jgi:hypothetical protein